MGPTCVPLSTVATWGVHRSPRGVLGPAGCGAAALVSTHPPDASKSLLWGTQPNVCGNYSVPWGESSQQPWATGWVAGWVPYLFCRPNNQHFRLSCRPWLLSSAAKSSMMRPGRLRTACPGWSHSGRREREQRGACPGGREGGFAPCPDGLPAAQPPRLPVLQAAARAPDPSRLCPAEWSLGDDRAGTARTRGGTRGIRDAPNLPGKARPPALLGGVRSMPTSSKPALE